MSSNEIVSNFDILCQKSVEVEWMPIYSFDSPINFRLICDNNQSKFRQKKTCINFGHTTE